ncbi:hypothetical protein B0H34DRAFT_254120 [Crassisporium funariophilum]|nr:hypothetical protein B0H34DRAFT_254120 [Crassisporium funariophilum]
MNHRTRVVALLPSYAADWEDIKDMDVSDIKGNVSEDMKRFSTALFRFFVSTEDKSYGAAVGQRLKFLEINIWGEGRSACGESIFEIMVGEDMCNVFGTLHGACAAYIVDPCSVSSLVTLGTFLGIDGTGVSQSMNLIWHSPVRMGTKLRVVATSMSMKGRVRSARCEVSEVSRRDSETI